MCSAYESSIILVISVPYHHFISPNFFIHLYQNLNVLDLYFLFTMVDDLYNVGFFLRSIERQAKTRKYDKIVTWSYFGV
jgi:hypothetical protein